MQMRLLTAHQWAFVLTYTTAAMSFLTAHHLNQEELVFPYLEQEGFEVQAEKLALD
jgi:hypothetical protein